MRNTPTTPKKPTPKKKNVDRTYSEQGAALSKLGRKLSGKGQGSADRQESRGRKSERELRKAVNTSKNAGERRRAPKKAATPPRSVTSKY